MSRENPQIEENAWILRRLVYGDGEVQYAYVTGLSTQHPDPGDPNYRDENHTFTLIFSNGIKISGSLMNIRAEEGDAE